MVQASDTTVGSPKNASDKEKKMLQIRGDLQGLIYKEDWSAVDGMIRGVRYADPDLASSLIIWKNPWQTCHQTLLHDMLTMPEKDPPLDIVKLVVDTAPQVLLIEDESRRLPLHIAIHSKTHDGKVKTASLEIIRFLVASDSQRKSMSPVTFWQAIRRGDENVIRYLLTFSECARALSIKVNGRVPLYYTCIDVQADGNLTPLVVLMIQATSDQLRKKSCCFYRAIENCSLLIPDPQALLEIAHREKLFCSNHLIDVARRRDTLAAAKKRAVSPRDNDDKALANKEEETVPQVTTAMRYRAQRTTDDENEMESEVKTKDEVSPMKQPTRTTARNETVEAKKEATTKTTSAPTTDENVDGSTAKQKEAPTPTTAVDDVTKTKDEVSTPQTTDQNGEGSEAENEATDENEGGTAVKREDGATATPSTVSATTEENAKDAALDTLEKQEEKKAIPPTTDENGDDTKGEKVAAPSSAGDKGPVEV